MPGQIENMREFTLSNGTKLPSVGFGTAFGNWTSPDSPPLFYPEQAWSAVPTALKVGYRHIDTAYMYNSHRPIGVTLGQQFASGALTRGDVWITTKLFHPPAPIAFTRMGKTVDMTNSEVNIYEKIMLDMERSLDELCVGYVDLVLMHWPGDFDSKDPVVNTRARRECWRAFEDIYQSGRARAIGVSNFNIKHLQSLTEWQDLRVSPMVNQIENSPSIQQRDIVDYCQQNGIQVVAWSPFGSGVSGVLTDPIVKGIAEQVGKNTGQVILRWLLQRGIACLPKSSSETRMAGNLDLFDFSLSEEQMTQINSMEKGKTTVVSMDTIA